VGQKFRQHEAVVNADGELIEIGAIEVVIGFEEGYGGLGIAFIDNFFQFSATHPIDIAGNDAVNMVAALALGVAEEGGHGDARLHPQMTIETKSYVNFMHLFY
jgi:hypothetical protein